MEINHAFIPSKEQIFLNPKQLLYTSILSRWFYVPVGHLYLPVKPNLFSFPRGFLLEGRMVYSVLSTHDEFEMRTTNAEAILVDSYFNPGQKKLKRLLSNPGKPVIVSIKHGFTRAFKLPGIAKKLETLGAAGIYTGRKFPIAALKKICSECSVPVFSASSQCIDEISLKINAGVFAVCISGKNISSTLIKILHELFPNRPVIALCLRSEKQMNSSLESGSDALIFKPCIPFDLNPEDF